MKRMRSIVESQEGIDIIKLLVERHWQQAHFNARERMWIAGIYVAAWGLILSDKLGTGHYPWVYLFPSALGFIGFIFIMKINFLYEFHIRRAQYYIAGKEEGVLTDINDKWLHYFSISFLFTVIFNTGFFVGIILLICNLEICCSLNISLPIILGMISLVLNVFIWRINGTSYKKAQERAEDKIWNGRIYWEKQ